MVFNIRLGVLQIPSIKLQEVITLCTHYFSKKFITKYQLQALIGSLIFLHKAIKPARIFVNRILALLRKMGTATKIAIDEGTKQDLIWFIACAHTVNGSVTIYKCLRCYSDFFQIHHGSFSNYMVRQPGRCQYFKFG
jgi:DNA-directed RNA polymerase subunit RPC12/RpoP